MRALSSILLFISISLAFAEDFTVFEKGGYYGIKDQSGAVTVPAVYERLGWSDGSSEVRNGVIGYKQNGSWGLITVRNKPLTQQKFYTIVPISANYFKASIKGKFSNRLFHGILDKKGKTLVSFNYFTIDPFGVNWLVSDFDGNRQLFGVVSMNNEVVIPTKYKRVSEVNSLLIAEQPGSKIDLYKNGGQLIQLGLDSLTNTYDGVTAYRDGYAGYLLSSGSVVYDFDYKKFRLENSQVKPVSFPEWKIYQKDTLFLSWQCDSLSMSENGMLIAFLNGAHHFLLKNETLLSNHELVLKEVSTDKMIVQNSKSRQWSVLLEDGTAIIKQYDSIHAMGDFFGARNHTGWNLHHSTGQQMNRFPFQELKPGVEGQFLAKKNDHWGILTSDASELSSFKYDSIVADGDAYVVSYLNMWGTMNTNAEWIIRPSFQEIFKHNDILIGRRGRGYSVFSKGEFKFKTTAKPTDRIGEFTLMLSEELKMGLLNDYGEMVIYPSYDRIQMVGDHFTLWDSTGVSLAEKTGRIILKPEENYQEVSGFSEEYFSVKKENRWGFVDDHGRLRISNRYDDVRTFQEGMAPVKLREKWGFINKEEHLVIQPYYQSVTKFNDGVSVVQIDGKYGLINTEGKEVLELIWKSINRLPTGNYIVQNMDDQFGLVNGAGRFILRSEYDHLQDFGNQVLVSKGGAWGVLDYSGHQIFKINHEEIKVVKNLTMVRN
ncbi:WG repeat-containing protein [Ekhidna sp.]|uniref:WG repeat-containing protein n=1 Tax=Ekhidna sp. TaxID=2608089 RepID=UPI0035184E2D